MSHLEAMVDAFIDNRVPDDDALARLAAQLVLDADQQTKGREVLRMMIVAALLAGWTHPYPLSDDC